MRLLEYIYLVIIPGYRNVLRQKRRSALVVSAALFGIMGILFMMANINAFFQSMINMTIDTGLGHVQIRPIGYLSKRASGMVLPPDKSLLPMLEKKFPDIKIAPRMEREAMIRSGNYNAGVMITGVDSIREKNISLYHKWIIDGSFFEQASKLESRFGIVPCVIGKVNAEKMELEIGNTLVLSLSDQNSEYISFRTEVIGIFESPSDELDKYSVLLKKKHLSDLYLSNPDRIGYIVLKSNNIDDALHIKQRLKSELINIPGIEIPTYREIEPAIVQLFDMSAQFRWITHLIMMLGFALILFDSVSMSVFDRMREIGVVRAIGARPVIIFCTVIFESIFLTATGAILGILTGGLITLYFYHFGLDLGNFSQGLSTMGMGSTIYPYFTLFDILESFLVALGVGFLSSIYPAIKAIRIEPVQAIYNR